MVIPTVDLMDSPLYANGIPLMGLYVSQQRLRSCLCIIWLSRLRSDNELCLSWSLTLLSYGVANEFLSSQWSQRKQYSSTSVERYP